MAVGGKRSINQEAPIELSVPTKDGNNNNNNNNQQQQQQYEEESSGDPSASSLNENEELSTMMDESSSSSSVDTRVSLKEQNRVKLGDQPNEKSHRKHVSFGTVSIQEHQLVLGDNPYSEGYPISIDWKHTAARTVNLDDFPQYNKEMGKTTRRERQLRLQQMGYRKTDIQMQERKRKIRLTEEWAFGDNKNDHPVFGMATTKRLMQRYVTR